MIVSWSSFRQCSQEHSESYLKPVPSIRAYPFSYMFVRYQRGVLFVDRPRVSRTVTPQPPGIEGNHRLVCPGIPSVVYFNLCQIQAGVRESYVPRAFRQSTINVLWHAPVVASSVCMCTYVCDFVLSFRFLT